MAETRGKEEAGVRATRTRLMAIACVIIAIGLLVAVVATLSGWQVRIPVEVTRTEQLVEIQVSPIHQALLDHDPPEEVRRVAAAHASLINQATVPYGTPLHLAVQQGNDAAVAVLLEAGADLNATANILNLRCVTALHLAAAFDDREVAGTLLRAGADPAVEDCEGRTALELAADYEGSDVYPLLAEAEKDDG